MALACASSACARLSQLQYDMQIAGALQTASRKIVEYLADERWTSAELDTLPFAVAAPIRQAIEVCRTNPPKHWTRAAYELIGKRSSLLLVLSNR